MRRSDACFVSNGLPRPATLSFAKREEMQRAPSTGSRATARIGHFFRRVRTGWLAFCRFLAWQRWKHRLATTFGDSFLGIHVVGWRMLSEYHQGSARALDIALAVFHGLAHVATVAANPALQILGANYALLYLTQKAPFFLHLSQDGLSEPCRTLCLLLSFFSIIATSFKPPFQAERDWLARRRRQLRRLRNSGMRQWQEEAHADTSPRRRRCSIWENFWMLTFGTSIRLTRQEVKRFTKITGIEPVNVKTLDDLDG